MRIVLIVSGENRSVEANPIMSLLMNGVLCRCDTYLRIDSAVQHSAEFMLGEAASHD